MNIRKAVSTDLDDILNLFLTTIQHVNKADYNAEQLKAWSSGAEDRERWLKKIEDQYFLVAEINNELAGFASITSGGYLDTMFVSKDHQRKGIAKLLLLKLLDFAAENDISEITTEGSITARPFFEKYGFEAIEKQELNRKGIKIINYKMKKRM